MFFFVEIFIVFIEFSFFKNFKISKFISIEEISINLLLKLIFAFSVLIFILFSPTFNFRKTSLISIDNFESYVLIFSKIKLLNLSVLIPYIGAAIVTLPIALVGYFQWGLTSDYNFTWLMISYFVIQFLDGNVLVPILFSEAVNLHPLAIIVAILVFGGIWGFWGVFFAIPLATLVKALINVWPVYEGK